MAAYTIVLTGAAGVTNVTPLFDFSSGTIAVEVEDVFIKNLTSGVEDDIALSEGEKLEYICSDWDAITRIAILGDKVSGDISGWTLLSNITIFNVSSTSLSGDISGWTLPSSLVNFIVHLTSLVYDSSTGAFEGVTNNLTKINFADCSLSRDDVDNVLLDLVTSGITNSSSSKDLDIGDDNSGPSFAGWANKLILEDRGWSVNINAAVQDLSYNRFGLPSDFSNHCANILSRFGLRALNKYGVGIGSTKYKL